MSKFTEKITRKAIRFYKENYSKNEEFKDRRYKCAILESLLSGHKVEYFNELERMTLENDKLHKNEVNKFKRWISERIRKAEKYNSEIIHSLSKEDQLKIDDALYMLYIFFDRQLSLFSKTVYEEETSNLIPAILAECEKDEKGTYIIEGFCIPIDGKYFKVNY